MLSARNACNSQGKHDRNNLLKVNLISRHENKSIQMAIIGYLNGSNSA